VTDKMSDLYAEEQKTLDHITDYLASMNNKESVDKSEFAKLVKEYKRALKLMRRITKHSDMLTNSLNESKQIAIDATQAKSKFLATMSHEIRTPMNAIIGISDIELENDTHSPEVLDSFDRINNSGKTLLGIINDILDMSKVETGKLELVPVKYETSGLINDTARLNIMRIGSKPIEFVIKVAETLPSVLFGDDLRIKQILNNMLSNSIKYTDKGTVTFGVDSEVCETGIYLVLTIADTGQGMTNEQLAALYDEYTMFNQEANRKTEGTGLGMSITKGLVEMMNGRIVAESEPGVGSIFKVYLLQQSADAEPLGKEIAENLCNFQFTSQATRKKLEREYMPYGSVLIVDDVDANVFVAKGLMKPYGFALDTASSGYEVLDKVRAGSTFDIIFMDHMMPGMDGVETTKILRDEGYNQPVVALTANAVAGMKEFFTENSFDDFVSKPIDTRQLNRVLNTFIHDKQPPEVLEEAKRQKKLLTEKSSQDETCRWMDECPRAGDCPRLGNATGTGSDGILSALKEIPGLEVDSALTAMNDMEDVYIDTVKLTVRLLPERIERMDGYIVSDIKSFAVEVHGLKSVLKNIGASALGNIAAGLERAALENDNILCNENYPPFKLGLTELEKNLSTALKQGSKPGSQLTGSQLAGDNSEELISKLSEAKTAAEVYDRDRGLELISPFADTGTDEETNELLEKITFAFEAFDCEEALNNITKLEDLLSGR